MARIGYKKAKYNKIVGDTYAAVSEKVPMFTKVVDEKFADEYNSAELYANDALAESDYSFKKGVLTLTVSDDEDALCAELLGSKITPEKTGEVTRNVNDSAPYVGYGHILTKKVDDALKYKVEVFPRIKFQKVTTDNKSRGESVEFGTTSMEAIVTAIPEEEPLKGFKPGDWEKHKTFDSYSEAETYLDGLLTPTV